jgi:hypothetical protein
MVVLVELVPLVMWVVQEIQDYQVVLLDYLLMAAAEVVVVVMLIVTTMGVAQPGVAEAEAVVPQALAAVLLTAVLVPVEQPKE